MGNSPGYAEILEIIFYGTAIILPVACLVAGLVWPRYRWAPFVATGLVVVAYLAVLAGYRLGAADCWDCYVSQDSDPWTRESVFTIVLWVMWIPFAGSIVTVWLAAGVSLGVRRFLGRHT